MVNLQTVIIGRHTAIGIEVDLPRTHLAIVASKTGYIMCGALDVALLSTRLREREIVAGRALGVKSVPQLLAAPLESVTEAAKEKGLSEGMTGERAMATLLDQEEGAR